MHVRSGSGGPVIAIVLKVHAGLDGHRRGLLSHGLDDVLLPGVETLGFGLLAQRLSQLEHFLRQGVDPEKIHPQHANSQGLELCFEIGRNAAVMDDHIGGQAGDGFDIGLAPFADVGFGRHVGPQGRFGCNVRIHPHDPVVCVKNAQGLKRIGVEYHNFPDGGVDPRRRSC